MPRPLIAHFQTLESADIFPKYGIYFPLANRPLSHGSSRLTDEAEADLPGVVQQVVTRLRAETTREQAAKMETAALILMGLRYEEALVSQLFQGVQEMEDSTTYQGILRRGKAEGQLEAFLDMVSELGECKFGVPDTTTKEALGQIKDPGRLRELFRRIKSVNSWHDLLA